MKYFTQELLNRNQTLDNDAEDAADEEWERRIEAYRHAIDTMALPPNVLSLARDYCFHDWKIQSVSRLWGDAALDTTGTLVVTLVDRDQVYKITYGDAYSVNPARMVDAYWLYEEVEAVKYAPSPELRDKLDSYLHHILTDEGEVTIRFKSVSVTKA